MDQFGLPQARRQVAWGDNDKKIFADMQSWSVEILKSAGAEIFNVYDEPATNHELGGCRMGRCTALSRAVRAGPDGISASPRLGRRLAAPGFLWQKYVEGEEENGRSYFPPHPQHTSAKESYFTAWNSYNIRKKTGAFMLRGSFCYANLCHLR